MNLSDSALRGEFISDEDSFSLQCETILESFEQSNDVVQAGRNTLKKVMFEGSDCVVKAFRIPSFPQNYSYGMFAKSKAKKSYDNAQTLIKMGFLTPPPVGFFEYRFRGKLQSSYYICEYANNVQTLHELWNEDVRPESDLIREFSEFCFCLHSQGILHRDFNPKNILVSGNNGVREFALVDINRITWYKKLSLNKAIESLSRLPFSESTRTLMLESYAKLSGVDLGRCQELLKKSEHKTQRYFRNKNLLRKIFPKK